MLESVKRLTELGRVVSGLSSGEGEEKYRVKGIIVEVGPDTAPIAVPGDLPCFGRDASTDVAGTSLGFLNVPIVSLSRGKPKGWTTVSTLRPWANKNEVMDAYDALMEEPAAAPSSTEVEQSCVSAVESRGSLRDARAISSQGASSAGPAAASPMPAALQGLLRGAQGLVGGSGLDRDDSDEGELLGPMMRPMMARRQSTRRSLPGSTASENQSPWDEWRQSLRRKVP